MNSNKEMIDNYVNKINDTLRFDDPLDIDIDFKKFKYNYLQNDKSVWVAISSELLQYLKPHTQVIIQILKNGSKNVFTALGRINELKLCQSTKQPKENPNIENLGLLNKFRFTKFSITYEPLSDKCVKNIDPLVLCDPNGDINVKYNCDTAKFQPIADQIIENMKLLKFKITDCSNKTDEESQSIIYLNINPGEKNKFAMKITK